MKTILSLLTLLLSFNISIADSDHDTFYKEADLFFKTYVKNGLVDYKAISKSPAQLNALIEMIETSTVDKSDAKDYQSFYINSYNLLNNKHF